MDTTKPAVAAYYKFYITFSVSESFRFEETVVTSLWEKAVEQLFPSWMAKQISPPLKTITFEKQPPGTLGRGLFERVPSDWEKRLIMEFTPQPLLRQRGYSSYGILLESLTWTLCFWECFPAQLIKILLCIYDTITRKCSHWAVCCFSNYQSWLQNWYTCHASGDNRKADRIF